MKQSAILLESEGDAWYARNKDRLGVRDEVSTYIEKLGLQPKCVLEIGCANGWRLKKLKSRYGCDVHGIEASHDAVATRVICGVERGTADDLEFWGPNRFDLVIFGFCLYLCDPGDLFRIVSESDRVLAEDGYIVIHDFAKPYRPFARKYKHHPDLLAYHMDFAALWAAHPHYQRMGPLTIATADGGDFEQIDFLRKEIKWKIAP